MAIDKLDLKKNVLSAGKSLAVFAIVASALVGLTFISTKTTIEDNERETLLKSLNALVPVGYYNNDLYKDSIPLDTPALNYRKKPITIYRARLDNNPVAAIFSVTAPDGYNGAINMLIAIRANETLSGVRVVSHKETPGLGDAIEIEKSYWIKSFDDKSLSNPVEKKWRVKKDGGEFDQLTGATITPRAIVKITKKSLLYFMENKDQIFGDTKNVTSGL